MLLPARTTKYIEALNREGDSFDYLTWLQRVREEEATPAEHVSPLINSREPTTPEIDKLIDTPDRPAALMLPRSRVVTRPATVPRSLRRINHEAKADTPKARLRRRLMQVRDAWKEFQGSRARDAVPVFGGGLRNRRSLQSAATDRETFETCLQMCRPSVQQKRRSICGRYSLHV
jgi:hypothetical protein